MAKTFIAFIFCCAVLSGCSDFVNDVEEPIDSVDSDLLTDESQIDFLIIGIQQRFATTYSRTVVLADALSDLLFFDQNVSGATFSSFEEIDDGQIQLDNASVEELFLQLGELRFLADDLIVRVNAIDFMDPDKEREALYVGYFFGGIARYLYATYSGLTENQGGGVIDNGPFIPSAAMYQGAVERLQQALAQTSSQAEKRLVNAIIARSFLFSGDDGNALRFAREGLVQGDAPFQALYSSESDNFYWSQAGRGRNQFVVDGRFHAYILEDPTESARIQIERLTGRGGGEFWRQVRYPEIDTPIDFISWQENDLMRAEIELRTGLVADALARVNTIRSSFGIAPLTSLNTAELSREREKTLFAQGLRLVDQRRLNQFHLADDAWRYLPIPASERRNNPNLD